MQQTTPTHARQPDPASLPLRRRLFRLCIAIGGLLLFMQATPYILDIFPPVREYNRVVQENDITPGALYYTDVPQAQEGEFNNRDAIRFRVR